MCVKKRKTKCAQNIFNGFWVLSTCFSNLKVEKLFLLKNWYVLVRIGPCFTFLIYLFLGFSLPWMLYDGCFWHSGGPWSVNEHEFVVEANRILDVLWNWATRVPAQLWSQRNGLILVDMRSARRKCFRRRAKGQKAGGHGQCTLAQLGSNVQKSWKKNIYQ